VACDALYWPPYGDVSGGDAGSWDLWWCNSTGNYPHNPNAGYYIYEAGKNGVVYIFNTSNPSSPAGTISVGGVAYGVYATEPAVAKLYVATTVGLKVYNIANPTSPTFIKTISGLSFVNVRGIAGYPYVFATSLSDNKMYAISTATDTIVSSTGLGITTTIRRQWVYQDPAGNYFDYVVDDSGDLWILNVNNPAAPVIVGSWTRPAGTPGPTNLPGGSVYVKQGSNYIGQGVYERAPSVQVKSQTISKFQTATYQVQVTNTADRIDRITFICLWWLLPETGDAGDSHGLCPAILRRARPSWASAFGVFSPKPNQKQTRSSDSGHASRALLMAAASSWRLGRWWSGGRHSLRPG
jgi:hypothetical protein